ncbi:hypothetical protein RQN30_01275 [Arcanobacterium hippocoleae]
MGLLFSGSITAYADISTDNPVLAAYEQAALIKNSTVHQNDLSDKSVEPLTQLALNGEAKADTDSNLEIETRGVKSWAAKKDLKSISGMIRSGGKQFIDLAGDFLDKETKTAIRNHSDIIADAIDDVAELPDLASHVVKEKLFHALSSPLGGGAANVIADAVAGVIWILV